MNYFQFHIGDYAQATVGLSLVEDAIYTRLLRHYYAEEEPLSGDVKSIGRIIGARSADELEALEYVLERYFEQTTDGWRNSRADQEIAAYHAKSEKAKAAGSKGGRAKAETSERLADAKQTLSERLANQEPRTINQEEASDTDVSLVASDAADCPHDEIRKVYAEVLPMLAQPKVWTGANQRNLRTRWREDPERQSVDWWRRFFVYVRGKPFLTGNNQRGWQADLGWLVKAENFAKVINGNFD